MSIRYAHMRLALREGLLKTAEVDVVPNEPQEELPEPKPVRPHPWMTAAKDIGAFGLGVGAGYGGLSLANRLSKQRTGKPLVSGRFAGHAIPVTMGLGSLLFSHWQNTLLDKMREQAAAGRANGSQES